MSKDSTLGGEISQRLTESHLSFGLFKSMVGGTGLAAIVLSVTATCASSNPDTPHDALKNQYTSNDQCLQSTPYGEMYNTKIEIDNKSDTITIIPKKIPGFLGRIAGTYELIAFTIEAEPVPFPILGFSLPANQAKIGEPIGETDHILDNYGCK